MKITELTQGQDITIIASMGAQQMEFKTSICEVAPLSKVVLATPVYRDDKLITFRGKDLFTDVLVPTSDGSTPQLFKNLDVTLVKKADGSLWYNLFTIEESKSYNRRGAFRCSVGVESVLQSNATREPLDIIIKDVSVTGFAFICSKDVPIGKDMVVQTILHDYIPEVSELYDFQLYGIVARSYEHDDTRMVHGCRLNHSLPGLEKYIVTKERIRLRNTHGGLE